MTVRLLLPVLLLFSGAAFADQNGPDAQVRQWRQSNEQQIVDRFTEFLSIPNVAADADNIRRNAGHISRLLTAAGMQVELLELEGSNPVVFAQKNTPGATQTLMIYIHYDGQPVNPGDWASDPWQPVMRTDMVEKDGKQVPMKAPFDPAWRIFGRSAGDDKAPVIALHSALLAMRISAILDKLSDRTLIRTPTMGGSLPLYIVEDVLQTPILILPIANHDNNQHGANENLRLQNLWDAIEIYAAVLTGL